MEYDFLQQFPRRMKSVGMYSLLVKNSWQKTTWKNFDIESMDEQLNIIFAVLLFVMEQSLKEEDCTIDDIGTYVDNVCNRYFAKKYSYEQSGELADFIVNVILSDEGRAMYFDCFDFEKKKYKSTNISYVANKIVYLEDGTKRTSYKLTDNGYNLVLSTLEIESNMKLTVHEMIFKMHLERATYDKALDEVKNIFNLLQIRLQKIEEAMNRIRRNALDYSVAEYQEILEENLGAIDDTKREFVEYQTLVRSRARELEEENINVKALSEEDAKKLRDLQKIEGYLQEALDQHQRILNRHFDLKELYTKELEQMSQMALIKRFSLRGELYDKIIEHPGHLTNLEYFFRPLFQNDVKKVYNLNRCLEIQRPIRKQNEADDEELLAFDAQEYEKEKEQKLRKRLKRYQGSLEVIVGGVRKMGQIELKDFVQLESEQREKLLPSVEIFKEIMVELLKGKRIDIEALRKEKSEVLEDGSLSFQLNEMLLDVLEKEALLDIVEIDVQRTREDDIITFEDVPDEDGNSRTIRCTNVMIQAVRREEKR